MKANILRSRKAKRIFHQNTGFKIIAKGSYSSRKNCDREIEISGIKRKMEGWTPGKLQFCILLLLLSFLMVEHKKMCCEGLKDGR